MRLWVFAVLAALLASGTTQAKEHGASCAAMPALVERLRGALVLASFHRARGSSLAAYETLRTSAASVAADAAACGILAPVLERALARARREETALAASLQMDVGLASSLAVVLTGRLPPEDMDVKLIDVAESAEYGEACPDLFRLRLRLDGPPETLTERAAALADELRGAGRCPKLRGMLEGARGSRLAHAVDSIRLDEPEKAPGDAPFQRCPELPIVLERIATAIAAGVPLYNRGDHEGCRRHYDAAARSLRDQVIPFGRCPAVRSQLEAALGEAARASDADTAAWALRRGFDRIAKSVRSTEEP